MRVIDVNFNRSKEGLRVTEDIFRFILIDDKLRRRIRQIRHSLDVIAKDKALKAAILSRDPQKDLGKKTDVLELTRKGHLDILYINLQRVKESLRVMEEFFKVVCPQKVRQIKKLRYDTYLVELQAIIKYFSKHKR